jgi:hypothetical protein
MGSVTGAYGGKVASTGTIKSGAGEMVRATITTDTTGGTVKIYDNTAASGTQIFEAIVDATNGPTATTHEIGIRCQTGIHVVLPANTIFSYTIT